MSLKLPYGLKNGVLTHIDEVLENGLKCGCLCPSCQAQLIAKKGSKKAHHFAHYNSPECSYGVQTALHLAAKEIIARKKKFRIPAYLEFPNIEQIFSDDENVLVHIPNIVTLVPEKTYEVQNVFLEKRISDFVPDIILEIGGQKLIVEIAVTHFIDDEKKKKIEREGISVIEINLSEFKDEFTLNTLERILVTETEHKFWIYNSKAEAKWLKWKEDLVARNHAEVVRFEAAAIEARKRHAHEQHLRQLEKEKRETFYLKHLRQVDSHTIQQPNVFTGGTTPKVIYHVRNCPEKKKLFYDEYYANVDTHCKRCQYFRGYKNEGKHISCLADYYKGKDRPINE